MLNFDKSLLSLAKISEEFEWRKWAKEIPYLSFPNHWLVKAIPPFLTGIIRYNIRTDKMPDEMQVSIYLDCYDMAGCVGKPYWEVYPVNGDVARFLMNDTAELLKCIEETIYELEEKSAGHP